TAPPRRAFTRRRRCSGAMFQRAHRLARHSGAQLLWKDRLSPKELRFNSSPQTAWITTRRPHGAADAGECAAIHYVVADGVVKVTDQDGNLLRYSDGEPCKQALGPDDNPKQIAQRL